MRSVFLFLCHRYSCPCPKLKDKLESHVGQDTGATSHPAQLSQEPLLSHPGSAAMGLVRLWGELVGAAWNTFLCWKLSTWDSDQAERNAEAGLPAQRTATFSPLLARFPETTPHGARQAT